MIPINKITIATTHPSNPFVALPNWFIPISGSSNTIPRIINSQPVFCSIFHLNLIVVTND